MSFKKGDTVRVIDQNDDFFGKTGTVGSVSGRQVTVILVILGRDQPVPYSEDQLAPVDVADVLADALALHLRQHFPKSRIERAGGKRRPAARGRKKGKAGDP